MNQQALLQMWDQMRQKNGIALRVIALLPADGLDSHPIPNMRTPKELIVHMYDGMLRTLIEGVVSGEVRYDESSEKTLAAGIKSRDELVRFARDRWTAADRAVASITDAELAHEVKTPFGMNFPGWVIFGITQDEFLHHRGQLYTYLRALGGEPPMMWDFANNEPAFQPEAQPRV
jgi:uncharacterized damage-inducible protein DinB